jgi:hypothetical protein
MGRHYDKPVRNLIGGLNATGHVTHTSHRKDCITLHHNGGVRLSHDQILGIWKTRPASAHLNVDAQATWAQYVLLNEYAWSTGSTNGNRRSISIEMANISRDPNWDVAEATWREAARMVGFLCHEVIGVRPSASNVVPHHFWKATTCAGPTIDRVMPQILHLANQSYDYFRGGGTPAPKPVPTKVQPKTISDLASEVLAGRWGNGEVRKRNLANAGHDWRAVQIEVNRRLGAGAPSANRPNMYELATQVIEGLWGNGEVRRQRLTGAGYNYELVQAEVNRRLR